MYSKKGSGPNTEFCGTLNITSTSEKKKKKKKQQKKTKKTIIPLRALQPCFDTLQQS